MLLKADEIKARLSPSFRKVSERLTIRPMPVIHDAAKLGAASLDLRLGCWFGVMRRSQITHLDVLEQGMEPTKGESEDLQQEAVTGVTVKRGPICKSSLKMHYIPFGKKFVLHPGDFVLAATLEWLGMPDALAGYVIGRSSWGRRGLIIETAAGVHPGFVGCLTLELTNVGVVPIVLSPGFQICQLFVHQVATRTKLVDLSAFVGKRRPVLSDIEPDAIAKALARKSV